MTISPPDPSWLDYVKLCFGFMLLLELGVLVVVIGIGTVKMESSYGLGEIIGCLLTLSGGFANWRFGAQKKSRTEEA